MSSSEHRGCAEYRALSRRQFLTRAVGSAAALTAPAWLPRVVLAKDDCLSRDVIVSIYLRGGIDGLTLCVPFNERAYYDSRPTLAIPPPDANDSFRAIDLDGFFGFPQQMAPLLPAYEDGKLLVVHATGSRDPSRSHFDAQRFMEVGKPNDLTLSTGWLGRHLASNTPHQADAVLRAVGIGFGLQRTLQGAPDTIPIPRLDDFGLTGPVGSRAARAAVIQDMYAQVGDPLRAAAHTTQLTIDLLDRIPFSLYQPTGGAVYPNDNFGRALMSTAALIKSDVGVEAVAIDLGGWDTHNDQSVFTGRMSNLMNTLAGGLAAFHADVMSNRTRKITVVALSEFGRQLKENGSKGTDHGHGNAMLVMGNGIAGGRVLTHWPGLARHQLFENRDLEVTIDYRDILAEVVRRRLCNSNINFVFPDFRPRTRGVTISDADFDRDGDVDLADYLYMSGCFNSTNQRPPAECCDRGQRRSMPCSSPADLDGDHDVDIADFVTFQGSFTGSQ